MDISRIYVGGWFQRTSLHLAEIYDFLRDIPGPLQLDAGRLRAFRDRLNVRSLELRVEDLEYIVFESEDGVETKIFEDGLIVISSGVTHTVKKTIATLNEHYDKKLSPALSYLFSLGAPVPKELANIKTIYPYFILLSDAESEEIANLFDELEEKKHSEVETKAFKMYRGNKLYVINNISEKSVHIEQLIQEQIFVREFKAQLHQYLNLHRLIWGKIASVKERGNIRGSDIASFHDIVDNYSKTINLIEARIRQMGAYISTRRSIFKSKKALQPYAEILEYEYETLMDTLSYIEDLWDMTKNYVKSSLHYLNELQEKSTEVSIKNLTVVTLLGSGAALFGLLARQELLLTYVGIAHVVAIAAFVYIANAIIRFFYKNHIYAVDNRETIEDIDKK